MSSMKYYERKKSYISNIKLFYQMLKKWLEKKQRNFFSLPKTPEVRSISKQKPGESRCAPNRNQSLSFKIPPNKIPPK